MAENNLPNKVLIVDDDPTVAGSVVDALSKYQIKVLTATDLESAQYHFNQNRLEVVCIKLDFEPIPGLVLLQRWRNHETEEKRLVGAVIMIGNNKDRNAGEARLMQEVREVETIIKPFSPIQLLPVISRARTARSRALKYEEIRGTIFKLGSTPEKLDKALGLIKKQLPELGPRGIEMMLELNEKHERWDSALTLADTLLAKDSNHVGYLNARGRILMRLGRHSEALQILEKADESAPDNIGRISALANAYVDQNRPDDAVKKMKQLIGYHPDQPDMKFDMFSQLQDKGFNDHALNLCKETTNPIEVVRYYNNKGVAMKNVGDTEGALAEYERSLTFFPKFKENYRIYYNIALAHISYKNAESYQKALECLNKCLELKKDFDKAITKKQQVTKALGKKKKPA